MLRKNDFQSTLRYKVNENKYPTKFFLNVLKRIAIFEEIGDAMYIDVKRRGKILDKKKRPYR
jgi:hypothetical protein